VKSVFRPPPLTPFERKQAQAQPFHIPRRAWGRLSGQTAATEQRRN